MLGGYLEAGRNGRGKDVTGSARLSVAAILFDSAYFHRLHGVLCFRCFLTRFGE